MIRVCSNRRYRLVSLNDDLSFKEAVEALKQEGPTGAQGLALMIDELLAARCIEILDALAAAGRLSPQQELVGAIRRVTSAMPVITSPTLHTRFPPVIVGGGRIGWDDSSARRIKEQAAAALKELGVDVEGKPVEPVAPPAYRGVSASPADSASETRSATGLVVTCEGCQKTYRLGVDAAVVTSEGVTANFMAVIVVGGDKVTGGTKDDPDLVAPYGEGRSPDAKMLAEVERLSSVRASRQARFWRCNPCGKTNRYPW